jgi:hypothetical protein
MTTSCLAALSKAEEEGSRYQVQLKLGTRHRKDSLHTVGRNREESTGCVVQSEVEVKQKVQIYSASGRVTGECWGPVGPWVWIKKESEEKGREKMKCELRGRHID